MLAILTTHPIQYQVPLWQALAKARQVPFEVWYLSDHAIRKSFDSEFGQEFSWDLDMLSGYPHRFLKTNANHDVTRFGRLRLAESLDDLSRTRNVKAIWVQGWQVAAYWQAVWQVHAAGIPVWLRGESNDLAHTSLWKGAIKRAALGHLFSRIKNFLYIGSANRRFYENFGVRQEQLYSTPYAVDNDRFAQAADKLRSQRDEIRRGWKIPQDSFCILFAGKFIPKKRPIDLVRAAANLQPGGRAKRIHLLFAGSGELGGELRSRCSVAYDAETQHSPLDRRGISVEENPTASFTGFLNQTEISRAYVAADCLILPSDSGETWGLVVNEAMASSLPCAVSDQCGCGEDLVRPIHGELCFRLGDLDGIGIALARLSNEGVERQRLKAQVDKYDFSVSVETVSRLYHNGS